MKNVKAEPKAKVKPEPHAADPYINDILYALATPLAPPKSASKSKASPAPRSKAAKLAAAKTTATKAPAQPKNPPAASLEHTVTKAVQALLGADKAVKVKAEKGEKVARKQAGVRKGAAKYATIKPPVAKASATKTQSKSGGDADTAAACAAKQAADEAVRQAKALAAASKAELALEKQKLAAQKAELAAEKAKAKLAAAKEKARAAAEAAAVAKAQAARDKAAEKLRASEQKLQQALSKKRGK